MKQILTLFLLIPFLAVAHLQGKVVGIADGDTFTMLTSDNKQIKVRLYGIDCPEKGQPFSNVCKQFLSDLIFKKNVTVNDKGLDRYGRTIGIIFLDTLNINESLLANGLAWHYKYYYKNQIWADLEIKAKAEKKGLWADPNPVPPWDWRKSH